MGNRSSRGVSIFVKNQRCTGIAWLRRSGIRGQELHWRPGSSCCASGNHKIKNRVLIRAGISNRGVLLRICRSNSTDPDGCRNTCGASCTCSPCFSGRARRSCRTCWTGRACRAAGTGRAGRTCRSRRASWTAGTGRPGRACRSRWASWTAGTGRPGRPRCSRWASWAAGSGWTLFTLRPLRADGALRSGSSGRTRRARRP